MVGESDVKAPNLPLSLRLKFSGCHYNNNYHASPLITSQTLAYIGRLYITLQIFNRLLSILFIYVCVIFLIYWSCCIAIVKNGLDLMFF